MENFFRSQCPITSGLDIFGDKWTLVIIKQLLFEKKSSFKDFTESQEAIATNILSSRLKMLESFQVVQKSDHPNNQKTKIYTLTEKGLSFTPILIELMLWSKENIQNLHPNLNLHPDLDAMKLDKTKAAHRIKEAYRLHKDSLFKTY